MQQMLHSSGLGHPAVLHIRGLHQRHACFQWCQASLEQLPGARWDHGTLITLFCPFISGMNQNTICYCLLPVQFSKLQIEWNLSWDILNERGHDGSDDWKWGSGVQKWLDWVKILLFAMLRTITPCCQSQINVMTSPQEYFLAAVNSKSWY